MRRVPGSFGVNLTRAVGLRICCYTDFVWEVRTPTAPLSEQPPTLPCLGGAYPHSTTLRTAPHTALFGRCVPPQHHSQNSPPHCPVWEVRTPTAPLSEQPPTLPCLGGAYPHSTTLRTAPTLPCLGGAYPHSTTLRTAPHTALFGRCVPPQHHSQNSPPHCPVWEVRTPTAPLSEQPPHCPVWEVRTPTAPLSEQPPTLPCLGGAYPHSTTLRTAPHTALFGRCVPPQHHSQNSPPHCPVWEVRTPTAPLSEQPPTLPCLGGAYPHSTTLRTAPHTALFGRCVPPQHHSQNSPPHCPVWEVRTPTAPLSEQPPTLPCLGGAYPYSTTLRTAPHTALFGRCVPPQHHSQNSPPHCPVWEVRTPTAPLRTAPHTALFGRCVPPQHHSQNSPPHCPVWEVRTPTAPLSEQPPTLPCLGGAYPHSTTLRTAPHTALLTIPTADVQSCAISIRHFSA